MCARVSVKFRSWPANQDTRGSNLVGNVGKNRINNRVNRYSSCFFFFSFFLWIQSIILRDTLTKYNEKKWKKKKKENAKIIYEKQFGRNEKVVFSLSRGKLNCLLDFRIVIFLHFAGIDLFRLCPYILCPLPNCQFNFGRGEKKRLYPYPVQNCLQLNK